MFYIYFFIRKKGRPATLLWSLALLLLGSSTLAQIPGMRKYTQLDGYNATRGYELDQDEKGYIWLGTDNGGMSFDGKTFRPALGAANSPDAEILFCRPLGAGNILLLPLTNTPGRLHRGRLITAAQQAALRSINMNLNDCKQDPVTGKWWLCNWKGGRLYSFKEATVNQYRIRQDTAFQHTQIINDKIIGFTGKAYNYHICFYDLKTHTFRDFRDSTGKKKLPGHEVTVDAGPHAAYLVAGLPEQVNLYRYHDSGDILTWVNSIKTPVKISAGFPNRVLLDPYLRLWIKTSQGIYFYPDILDSRKKSANYYFPGPAFISSIFVDRNRNIWLSSRNNALYFLSAQHFENELLARRFPHRDWIPQAITGDGRGNLCISYANQAKVTAVTAGQISDIGLGDLFLEGSRHILPLSNSRFILYDKNMALFDMRKKTLKHFHPPRTFKDVSAMGDSALVFAATEGTYYSSNNPDDKQPWQKIFDQRSTSVEVLADKRLLIGTPRGLYIKNNLDAPAVNISHPVLKESNITDLLAKGTNGAFIATNAQGLFIMDDASHIRQVRLPGSNNAGHIRRLYQQNDSTYWVATDNGAYMLIFDRNWSVTATKNYSFYDGLPSNNVTDVYVQQDTAYFATTQGLGIVPVKDTARFFMAPPSIYVNAVRADDTVFYEPDSIISLAHKPNEIQVSLSAISYESLGNTSFYYRLYPTHSKWLETSNPEIRFSGLPPGRYTFIAYAINAKQVKSKQPVVLQIEIQPAFWQTAYFIIGLCVFTAILLFLVLRWSMRRGEQKRFESLQQKKRLAELELEAIKAQINPHFIYNCLNSIKYLNYTGAYQQTQEYLSIFARLIRMTLQYSRRTFITVAEEIDYLSSYLQLEQLRFKEQLQYSITVEESINRGILLPAMLLQPYVENALKHGVGAHKEGGMVSIAFLKTGDCLEVMIRDNGPGFSQAGTSDTLGMHLSGTRAMSYNELFHLDIKVEYYNQQEHTPGQTGAVVKIIFNTPIHEPILS